jgi:hypothetical protein
MNWPACDRLHSESGIMTAPVRWVNLRLRLLGRGRPREPSGLKELAGAVVERVPRTRRITLPTLRSTTLGPWVASQTRPMNAHGWTGRRGMRRGTKKNCPKPLAASKSLLYSGLQKFTLSEIGGPTQGCGLVGQPARCREWRSLAVRVHHGLHWLLDKPETILAARKAQRTRPEPGSRIALPFK